MAGIGRVNYRAGFLHDPTGPVVNPSTIQMTEIVTWLMRHIVFDGVNPIRLNYMGLTDDELNEMRALGGGILAFMDRDIRSFRLLLQVIVSSAVITRQGVETLDGVITAVQEDSAGAFARYYGRDGVNRAADAGPYTDLCQWAVFNINILQYVESKIQSSLQLLDTYETFVVTVDPLSDSLVDLELGNITIDRARDLSAEAFGYQKTLLEAYNNYFNPDGDLRADQVDVYLQLFQALLPDIQFQNDLLIQDIRDGRRLGTLHNFCCNQRPITFQSWAEVQQYLKDSSAFRNEVKKFKPDIRVVARQRADCLYSEMVNLKGSVDTAEADPESMDLFDIKSLCKDLDSAYDSIIAIQQDGIKWSLDNFGCTRETLNSWRKQMSKLKDTFEKKEKQEQDLEKKIQENYEKNVKTQKLPKVTIENWREFLLRYRAEHMYYMGDHAKLAVIKDSLVSQEDIDMAKRFQDPTRVMQYLEDKYGSIKDLIPGLVDQLTNLRKPAADDDALFKANLQRITLNFDILEQEGETVRLDFLTVGKIIDRGFPDLKRIHYWDDHLVWKKTLRDAAILSKSHTGDSFDKAFKSSEFQARRLTHLRDFMQHQVDLCNLLASSSTGAMKKKRPQENNGNGRKPHNEHLVDQREKFNCPLCKSDHKDSNGRIRRYYFSGVCSTFAGYSIERKRDFLKKNKLCLICSCSKKEIGHDHGNCPKVAKFYCRICLSNGQKDSSKLHHSEVHIDSTAAGQRNNHKKKKDDNHKPPPPPSPPQPPNPQGPAGYGGPLPLQYQGNYSSPYQGAMGYPGYQFYQMSRGNFNVTATYYPPPRMGMMQQQVNGLSNNPSAFECCPPTSWNPQDYILGLLSKDKGLAVLFGPDIKQLATFYIRHYFQSCLTGSIWLKQTKSCIEACLLSDSGATLNFGTECFFKRNGYQPIGTWSGQIKSLTELKTISTPFYRVYFQRRDRKELDSAFFLSTPDIGDRAQTGPEVLNLLGRLHGLDPRLLDNPMGPISLLIGLENSDLLLEPVTVLDGRPLQKWNLTKDLKLNQSPLSRLIVCTGAIGGMKFSEEARVFTNQVQPELQSASIQSSVVTELKKEHGTFVFIDEPSTDDIAALHGAHFNYMLRGEPVEKVFAMTCKVTSLPIPPGPPQDGPGGDGGSAPGANAGAHHAHVEQIRIPIVAQPQGNAHQPSKSADGSTRQNVRLQHNFMKLLPGWSLMSAIMLVMSLTSPHIFDGKETNDVTRYWFPNYFSSHSPSRNSQFSQKLLSLFKLDEPGKQDVLATPTFLHHRIKPPVIKVVNVMDMNQNATFELISRKQIFPGQIFTLMLACQLLNSHSGMTEILLNQDQDPKKITDQILGDLEDKRIMSLNTCDTCKRRSKSCSQCRWNNSPRSIEEVRQMHLLEQSIWVKKLLGSPGMYYIVVRYPLDGPVSQLYGPQYSNSESHKNATRALYKRFVRKGILTDFHCQVTKSIDDGHIELLDPEETTKVLNSIHCFSGINYQEKPKSGSHKLRMVTNSSSHHKNGSLNSHCPKGQNQLGNMKSIFTGWRLNEYGVMFDLSRCYRSIHTDPQTNNLRLMWWVSSPEKAAENLDSSLVVLRLLRLTYGDQPAASILELVIRNIIAPKCSSELAEVILRDHRYVDDGLTSHSNQDLLYEAMLDLESTLNTFGFAIKRIISERLSFHKFRGLLLPDGSTSDGQFTAEETTEVVFHHEYNFRDDTVALDIQFNLHNKSRGRYLGPNLCDHELDGLIVNKKLLARAVGQCYSVTGSMIDPLLIALKILFSLGCKLETSWTTPITDASFYREVIEFLQVVKLSYRNLKAWPRQLIPSGYTAKAIACHSDGATWACSFVHFLISAMVNKEWTRTTGYSLQADAGSHLKSHSIPCNECIGLLEGFESVVSFIYNHWNALNFSTEGQKLFKISFGIDSSCVCSSLNPGMIQKQVLVRNAVTRIYDLAKELTGIYPVEALFYHNKGSSNIADLNSKIGLQADPINLINSDGWRHGLVDFVDPNFPDESRIFLRFSGGKQVKWCQPQIDQSNCHCRGFICRTTASLTANQPANPYCVHPQCTEPKLAPEFDAGMQPIIAATVGDGTINLTGLNLINFVPELPVHQYKALVKKYNLVRLTRLIARAIPATLPQNIQKALGWSNEFRLNHAEKVRSSRTVNKISDNEMPTVLLRWAFLVIVKSSNKAFKPERCKLVVNGLCLQQSRYSHEAMDKIFGCSFMPVISTSDKSLTKRIFENAHVRFITTQEALIEQVHSNLTLTMQSAKFGPHAVTTFNMRSIFKTFKAKCPFCLKHDFSSEDGKFVHKLSDPRLVSLLCEESPVFHTSSGDIVGPFTVKSFHGSRGKNATYCINGLFLADLCTGLVSVTLMDNCTKTDVYQALRDFASKYRVPQAVVTDKGPQLAPLTEGLKLMGIKHEAMEAGHQFLNFSERSIQTWKGIMGSMRTSLNRSIYDQGDTLIQLNSKLLLAEEIMSLKPILVKHNDKAEITVNARQLARPYLSSDVVLADMERFLNDIDCQGSPVLPEIIRNNEATRRCVASLIRSYLQDSALSYLDQRRGGGAKQVPSGLTPEKGDFITFLDSAKLLKFGLIEDILSHNTVEISFMKNNKKSTKTMHTRLLKLVYRSSDRDCHVNMGSSQK